MAVAIPSGGTTIPVPFRDGHLGGTDHMANTKKLPREERAKAKRKSRREAKALYASLTREQRKEFRKRREEITLKQFLAEKKEKEKAAPPEAAG